MLTNKFIPVNEPLLNGNEKKYLSQCINSGWISSEGPFVKKFENELAKKVGRKFAIAVSNGTSAIEASFKVLKINKGDEVIMPTFTIISSILPLIKLNAKPILIDCDPTTWNMDVNQIEKKITKKTKAIFICHIYGLPVDIDPVLKIAKKYKLKIIEDAAEAHGLKYKNKICGSFGDISIFSFYSNKLITSGEGGMILTDSKKLAEECRSIRNLSFGKSIYNRFIHNELGYNFRMTNLQAAVGLAQLEKWDAHLKKKIHIGNLYNKMLSNIENIQLPLEKNTYSNNVYWIYGIVLKKKLKNKQKHIMNLLTNFKIGTRPFFWPMHLQPILKKMGYFNNIILPNSENIAKSGFYIPSGLSLKDSQIRRVSKTLRTLLLNI